MRGNVEAVDVIREVVREFREKMLLVKERKGGVVKLETASVLKAEGSRVNGRAGNEKRKGNSIGKIDEVVEKGKLGRGSKWSRKM